MEQAQALTYQVLPVCRDTNQSRIERGGFDFVQKTTGKTESCLSGPLHGKYGDARTKRCKKEVL